MKVLVDTSVWSLALRRKPSSVPVNPQTILLSELIQTSQVVMVGPVRQELLSGISDEKSFVLLKEKLDGWDDLQLNQDDYIKAAEFCNIARRKGIQGSPTDFLLCAIAYHRNLFILTTDIDFDRYATVIPIKLLK